MEIKKSLIFHSDPRRQFERLYGKSKTLLKSEALHSRLKHAPIRTIAWMTFLGILPREGDFWEWREKIVDLRYEENVIGV